MNHVIEVNIYKVFKEVCAKQRVFVVAYKRLTGADQLPDRF